MALAFHDHRPRRHDAARRPRRPAVAGRPAGGTGRERAAPLCARAFVRRRAAAGAALVALGVAGFVAVSAMLGALAGRLAPRPADRPASVERPVVNRTVQPGDTLWDVAASVGGHGDIRARVDELTRLNGGGVLQAGDTLRIPAEWAGGRRP